MIKNEQLAQLEKLHCDEGVVSLYIKVEPRLMYEQSQPLLKFKDISKHFLSTAQDPRRIKALERERQKITDFLYSWIVRGRGLAIFACEPINLWEVIYLDVEVPTSLDVDHTPKTTQLLQVLDEYPPFVVALVQKDQAQIFVAEQRRRDKKTSIESEVHGWHKQGGWSQSRFQHHIDNQVNVHLRKVVDDLERLYHSEQPFGTLVIGGTDETTKELIKLLPDPIMRRVIGTYPVDPKHQTEEEMLNKAYQIYQEHERLIEKELVDQIVNESRAGGHGVVGIDATLPTIMEGRVHKLVIAEGAPKEGSVCKRCEFMTTKPFDRCPLCGGELDTISDIVDRAAERAFLAGAEVETVYGEASDWLLAQGGIGALLRY